MKTGRLLKFVRPAAEIQAYIYRGERGVVHGVVYVVVPGTAEMTAKQEIRGADEDAVEREVRAWIDSNYPRPSP